MAKQARLPGTGDGRLEDLHDAAENYADLRDQRMVLLEQEVASKSELMAFMKKHRKQHYKFNGLEITVEPGEEKIKVKIQKKEQAEEAEKE